MRSARRWACAAAWGLLTAACHGPPAEPRNVLLVGVDTLRADHLGLYGYGRDTSPVLDRFAEEAVVFEQCITPSPRTTPAVASLMTGLHPVHTGVRTLLGDLEDDAVTLASVLRDHGYRTVGVVATGILDGRVEQGFDVMVGTPGETEARRTTDLALAQLEKLEPPWLLWVFYRDPHMDYRPPAIVFDRDYAGPAREGIGYPKRKRSLVWHNSLPPRVREHVVALYDSEIRHTDAQIGRLLAAVAQRDPGAVIAVTADHGEALGERGFWYDHGPFLDQPAIRVPLLIRGLDLPPQRVRGVVRIVDVMPTLLAALGIDPSGLGLDGVDLAGAVVDGAVEGLDAFSESGFPILDDAVKEGVLRDRTVAGKKRSLVSGDLKLIHIPTEEGFRYELYDLAADPGEKRDLWGQRDVSELRQRLDAWVARDLEITAAREAAIVVEDLSPEERRQLRDLGYID